LRLTHETKDYLLLTLLTHTHSLAQSWRLLGPIIKIRLRSSHGTPSIHKERKRISRDYLMMTAVELSINQSICVVL